MIVALYLIAIVAANLLVARFGPGVTIINAFLLIGFDLSARDTLHERWHRRGLWWKMALLVGSGSALSWVLNRDAGPIAIASFVAFAAAGLIDLIVYHFLRKRFGMFGRMTGSNVLSAAVDSIVFPTLAFGGFLPLITLGQWTAKVVGGSLWAWVLSRPRCAVCNRPGALLTLIDAETLERTSLHQRCLVLYERRVSAAADY